MSTQAEPSYDAAPESSYPPVEAALAQLAAAQDLPMEQRVGAFEQVHRLLADALDAPVDQPPAAGA